MASMMGYMTLASLCVYITWDSLSHIYLGQYEAIYLPWPVGGGIFTLASVRRYITLTSRRQYIYLGLYEAVFLPWPV